MDLTIPAVKAALHRGRARLREIAKEPDDTAVPALAERERWRLAAYVDRFNARDFDAVRNMLADDVRLDLVAKLRLSGRSEVGNYFGNYSRIADWRLVPGLVDRRPAALVFDPGDSSGRPTYFVLLEWGGDGLVNIRDFRFARYAIEGAELLVLG
jgi:RNA polymerase sigma-70 factor, ECF subfamily